MERHFRPRVAPTHLDAKLIIVVNGLFITTSCKLDSSCSLVISEQLLLLQPLQLFVVGSTFHIW